MHVLVSTPSFVALPIALLFAARAFGTPRWIPVSAAILGVATVAASIAFFVTSNSSDYGGLWERAALWPVFVWMGWSGWLPCARSVSVVSRDPTTDRMSADRDPNRSR